MTSFLLPFHLLKHLLLVRGKGISCGGKVNVELIFESLL